MKMSDVWNDVDFSYGFFDAVITSGGEEFSGSENYPLCGLIFTNEEPAKAVMHAVKNHDALVDALDFAIHELMFLAEFYNKVHRSNVTSDQLDPPEVYDYQSIHEYIQAWKNAKGES